MKVEKLQVQEVNLKAQEEKNFEVHKEHHDLFVCVEGEVRILLGSNQGKIDLTEYDKERDFLECSALPLENIILSTGKSLLVKKGVPHKPGLFINKSNKKATIILAKLVD